MSIEHELSSLDCSTCQDKIKETLLTFLKRAYPHHLLNVIDQWELSQHPFKSYTIFYNQYNKYKSYYNNNNIWRCIINDKSIPIERYRKNTFYKVLDQILMSINSWFFDTREILKDLCFLSPERSLKWSKEKKPLPVDCFTYISNW